MRYLKRILFITALMLSAGFRLQAQTTVTVDVPRVVEADETFRLVFNVNAQPESFNPPAISGFDVLAGPSSSTMSSTQIVNGKRTESFQVSYTYILQAKSTGKFTIPPASVVVGGKSYSSQPVAVEVVKGDAAAKKDDGKSSPSISNDDVFLRVSLSKSRVVKGEQLVATIKLYTRVPIAGFEDVKFPSFNGFWSQEIETPQSIEFVRESIDGKIYNAALLRRYMLMPQQSGTLPIETAELICQVQVRSTAAAAPRSIFDDFFDSYQTVRKRVTAPTVRVVVDPLPAGAPASFTGAVGNFNMNAKLSRDSVNANEAFSLIINITGTGNINLIEAPKIEFPASFEVYDVKISGNKQFEYPVIARGPGEYTIPGFEFSYYDIANRRYVTQKSGDFNIKVGRDAGGTASSGVVQTGVNRQAVRSIADDIRFIYTKAPGLKRGNLFLFGSAGYFIMLAMIIALFFVAEKILSKRVERNRDVAGVKNRRANKVARARLKNAESLLKQGLYTAFYEELHRAILGYTSDKLNLSLADMSREKIKAHLESKKVQESRITELLSIIEQCEYARYAPDPGGTGMEENYQRAIRLISEMEV